MWFNAAAHRSVLVLRQTLLCVCCAGQERTCQLLLLRIIFGDSNIFKSVEIAMCVYRALPTGTGLLESSFGLPMSECSCWFIPALRIVFFIYYSYNHVHFVKIKWMVMAACWGRMEWCAVEEKKHKLQQQAVNWWCTGIYAEGHFEWEEHYKKKWVKSVDWN